MTTPCRNPLRYLIESIADGMNPAGRAPVRGRPYGLSTMHGNANSDTLNVIKRRDARGVLPDEIRSYPDGLGSSRAYRFNGDEPLVMFRYSMDGEDVLGYPLFGDVGEIEKWAEEQGLYANCPRVSQERAEPVKEDAPGEILKVLCVGGAEFEDDHGRRVRLN